MTHAARVPPSAAARRIGWGLGDQMASSLTNFAAGIYAARTLGAAGFGIFSLAWVTYSVMLGLSRGLSTDPLTVRFGGRSADSAWRTASGLAAGTALLVGLLTGALNVVVGLVVGGDIGRVLIALGVVLPGLLLQDAWRYAFFAACTGRKALINDAVWGLALLPTLFLARAHSAVLCVLCWGGAAAVAALFGLVQTRIRPDLRGSPGWVGTHRHLGLRYLVENVSQGGEVQIRTFGLGAIAGVSAVGAVRGAVQLLGPALLLLFGLCLVTVPEAARILRTAPEHLWRFCVLLGFGQTLAALAWGWGFLHFLPDTAGRWVLGPLWDQASGLIVPTTVAAAGAGAWTAAAAGLRALGASRRSMRCQLVGSGSCLILGLIGAALDGARGSTWGVGAAGVGAAALWWFELRQGLRDHLRGSPAQVPRPMRSGSNGAGRGVSGARALTATSSASMTEPEGFR